jgi:serine/threonine-protein kinase
MPNQLVAGRYRILERIGSGGMGLIFLAEQLGAGNKVALKFLDPEPSDDDSRLARFIREGAVGVQVKHPGAAQLLDFGRDDSMRLFLCFEYVEGEDLREVLRAEGRLHFREARDITARVAEVLAFAHERDIVHRDIKPENIRLRRDGATTHVKVLDFGIARLLSDSGARLTAEGMLAGTPRYMAPEQVNDEPLDGRLDQYALGLVFFEMLTGHGAIPGRNVTQILMNQLQVPVPALATIDPALASPEVDAFLSRACAKERAARFPTMHAFLDALMRLRVDEARWPAPPPRHDARERDRDSTRSQRPGAASGLSDTYVRPAERTEPSTPRAVLEAQEVRPDVPTQPERQPVARRQPTTEPARAATSRPEPPGEQRQPHLELPTDPERPAVPRRLPAQPVRHVGAETVMGLAPPPKPKSRQALVWLVVLALSGAIGFAVVWWLTRA